MEKNKRFFFHYDVVGLVIHNFKRFFFRMKSLDLETMKKLDTKVNIIPVIAKADTITKAELQKFKLKVSNA